MRLKQRTEWVVPDSVARGTLEQARFFLAEAESAAVGGRRDALGHFMEAYIVFARSVTLHLQKELAHADGFADWYATQQDAMVIEPLFGFFRDRRNYILKEGRLGVRRTVHVTVREYLHISGSVKVRVKRGKPWYRRSPKILLQDALYPVREAVANWQRKRQSRARVVTKEEPVDIRESWHFDDDGWTDTPAFDLATDYLDRLEAIVSGAEVRFRSVLGADDDGGAAGGPS